ncbi:Ribosome biogenesis ATPase RIX7 [Paramyrothecium foliicola]|nr:Ribosome biogenesis ATPase RIX7 [Paramyrothecium foliicola]
MTLGARQSRINLRQGLDRDVYQILKKLEDANDGKPFKTVTAVYDAIKRSNSSLSRQKKRPLEDSIDRVLQFRKEELGESDDSEAELEEEIELQKQEDDRFLLNRQMTKFWQVEPAAVPSPAPAPTQDVAETRPGKKRRLREDGNERDTRANGGDSTAPGTPGVNGADAPIEKSEKGAQKKSLRTSRFKVEQPAEPQALAGMDETRDLLLRQTRYVLKWPDLYNVNNWRKVPGILLSGPPGIGKSSLVRSIAAELEVPLISLGGCFDDQERMEKSLYEAIDEAMRLAPSIIFIEQLDWYMPKPSGSSHSEHNRRALTLFVQQMKRIQQSQPSDKHILAVATTSRITDVDPFALRTGLFERTIQMQIPDLQNRQDIFKLLTKDAYLAEDVKLDQLAKITHGFVGADMVNVVTIAEQLAAERAAQTISLHHPAAPTDTLMLDGVDIGIIDSGKPALPSPSRSPIHSVDFERAIKDFTPSLRKEGFTVIPDISWEQVGALEVARRQLKMSIIGPIKDPELYEGFGLTRPAGVLLWGPPGCGKTLVAQAVANEAQASFILINGPELLNKYVGESERAVRELFERARSSKPCIIFFDEIDSLVPRRDNASTESGARVVNALLTELDGARDRSGIYVIGTTNRPDMIDPAMLRPGRLSVRLFIDLPTADERVDILRAIYRTRHASSALSTTELESLERVARDPRCRDFSGADLGGLHVKAAEWAMQRYMMQEKTARVVDDVDWEHALANTRRSVLNPETYRKLDSKLGRAE